MEPDWNSPAPPAPILTPCQGCGEQITYVVVDLPDHTFRVGTWCCLTFVTDRVFTKVERLEAQRIVDEWNRTTPGATL